MKIRLSLSLLGAAALVLVAGPTASTSAPDAGRPAPVAHISCKPQAAIDVALVQAESSTGSRVDLDLSIRPEREFLSLRWELVLPADGVHMEGELGGEAAVERHALTDRSVSLSLPADGLHRQASVLVHGTFLGMDETGATFEEAVSVEHSLSWGERPAPAPEVISRDVVSGEMTRFIALPTAHREGR
jgi:hypothetical protein